MIKLFILGRLVKDVEIVFAKESGKAVAKFTLAVNEGKDRTSYHDVTAFGKTAELLQQYTKKGQMIFIDDATIFNNVYEKDGEKIYKKDIIANSFKFC